jgi:hypothetical protein
MYDTSNNAKAIRSFWLLLPQAAPTASLYCGEAKLSRYCLGTKIYLQSIDTCTAFKSVDFYHLSEKRTKITLELLNSVSSTMTCESSLDRIVGHLTVFGSFLAFVIVCTGSGLCCSKELLHPPLQGCLVALVPSEMRLALLKCSSMMEVVSIFLSALKAIPVAGEVLSRSDISSEYKIRR